MTQKIDTSALRYRPGLTFADVDSRATPGFDGSREDGEALQAELSGRLGLLQEMLYANGAAETIGRCCWCCRAWTLPVRVELSNMLWDR